MYERILRQMRENIRSRQYVMTLHAEEEMNDDLLGIFDVERAILTGTIVERQENHVSGEWKYLVSGESIGWLRRNCQCQAECYWQVGHHYGLSRRVNKHEQRSS